MAKCDSEAAAAPRKGELCVAEAAFGPGRWHSRPLTQRRSFVSIRDRGRDQRGTAGDGWTLFLPALRDGRTGLDCSANGYWSCAPGDGGNLRSLR